MSSAKATGAVFDALGDRNRRTILELLGNGPRSVAEIGKRIPISQPAISRHLRLLKAARLVQCEPMGARRMYSLSAEGAEAARRYMERLWGDVATRYRVAADEKRGRRRGHGRT